MTLRSTVVPYFRQRQNDDQCRLGLSQGDLDTTSKCRVQVDTPIKGEALKRSCLQHDGEMSATQRIFRLMSARRRRALRERNRATTSVSTNRVEVCRSRALGNLEQSVSQISSPTGKAWAVLDRRRPQHNQFKPHLARARPNLYRFGLVPYPTRLISAKDI